MCIRDIVIASTEIYSLGATLYKLLTGITPPSTNQRIAGEDIAPLPDSVSQPTRCAVAEAMRLNKTQRPQSIREFLALLSDKAVTPVNPKKPEDGTVIDEEPRWGEVSDTKKKKKSRLVPITIAVACLAAIGIVVAFLLKPKPAPIGEELAIADSVAVDTLELVSEVVEPEEQEEEVVTPAATQETQTAQQSKPTIGTINGHEYVDLGLSVKWATCNVGASSPAEYGNYYAWGETTTKSEYTQENSKTYGKSMGSIVGNPNYDAARANWGGTWRLPTLSEIDELINKCQWTEVRMNDCYGINIIGPNGNIIFFPAAGFCAPWLNLDGDNGCYWSATPYESDTQRAYGFYFHSGIFDRDWSARYSGDSVRPVSD
ncbi:MAG: hypothetical protein LUI09_08650, partial [Prevotellaceae bacterium]|nr:hypothetical protein [Prevotellaceae bacterium]